MKNKTLEKQLKNEFCWHRGDRFYLEGKYDDLVDWINKNYISREEHEKILEDAMIDQLKAYEESIKEDYISKEEHKKISSSLRK